MKYTNDLIKDIIDNIELLGINFDKSTIKDTNISYNNVKINYIDSKGRYIEKLFKDFDLNDILEAYNYKLELLKNSKSNNDIDKLNVKGALISLKDYINKEDKELINEMIIDYITVHFDYTNTNNDIIEFDDEKPNKVIDAEVSNGVAKDAKDKINGTTIAVLVGVIIVCTTAGVSLYKIKQFNDNKKLEQNIDDVNNEENNEVITEDIQDKTPVIETNNTEDNEETVEDTKEEIDVLSEEYVSNVTNKIYSSLENTDLANEYSKDDIKKLVNYARGTEDLSHETVYEIFATFIRHGVNVSMFFEGLDNYEDLNNLDIAVKNIVPELDKYDDEYNAFKAIDKTLNNMNENDFEEAVALRAYSDYYIASQSMTLMLNVTEYDEKGQLIDHGNLYNEQINGIDFEKISECQNIYNNVNPANNDAKLTKIINKALDESKSR